MVDGGTAKNIELIDKKAEIVDDKVFRAELDQAIAALGRKCLECEHSVYQPWISVTYGILLCINCAGEHRGLGVQTSRIKDFNFGTKFTQKDLLTIQLGGHKHFKQHVLRTYSSLPEKYSSTEVLQYRSYLEKLVSKCIEQKIEIEQDEKQIEKLISNLNGVKLCTNEDNGNQFDKKDSIQEFKPATISISANSGAKTKLKKRKGLSALNDSESTNKLPETEQKFCADVKIISPIDKSDDKSQTKPELLSIKKPAEKPKTSNLIQTDAKQTCSTNRLGFSTGQSLIRENQTKIADSNNNPNTNSNLNSPKSPSREQNSQKSPILKDSSSPGAQKGSTWTSLFSDAIYKLNDLLD